MENYQSIWQKYTKSKEDLTLEEYQSLQLEIAYLKKQLSTQSKLIKQSKSEAHQDSLTQLWNRRKFTQDLEKVIQYNNRYGRKSGIFFIDLNQFKAINDTLGHLAGDKVLQHVSNILSNYCRLTDEVYRLGGDEFVIIMPESNIDIISNKCKQLEVLIENTPCIYKGQEVNLSASIGTCIVDGIITKEQVLENADKQMYQTKQLHHDTMAQKVRLVS